MTTTQNAKSLQRRAALSTASALALATALSGVAHAQTAPAAAAPRTQVEEVVVTASRITSSGFTAPTPTTVLDARVLEDQAKPSIVNALADLPSMNATVTQKTVASNTTISGALLNPRNLGNNRVLVLVDGQRIVGAGLDGSVDISQLPQQLIKRVDVVTGGASASWGSNAVSGVVNFVLDNNFEGFKADINGGITTYGDDPTYQVRLTVGTALLNDRGHFVLSTEVTHDDGIRNGGDRPWYQAEKVIPRSISNTPAGQPQYVRSSNVYEDQVSPGGIITAGPLKGTTFGAGGRPSTFTYGSNVSDPFMIGGTPVDLGENLDLASKYTRASAYSRFTYELTPNTNVWLSGIYSSVRSKVDVLHNLTFTGNLTIQCDNAFLPPEIAAACATNKITSFAYGTSNSDIPPTYATNDRTLSRLAVGGDGSFEIAGKKWTWDAYGEYSANSIATRTTGSVLTPLYNLAIDAIRDGNGRIVCRSAAARAGGCVPLNIIGTGVADPASLAWVEGSGARPHRRILQEQKALSFAVNGQPFDLWAGPVSIATGLEYRKESYVTRTVDAYSVGNGGNPLLSATGSNWFTGSGQAASGAYDVGEGFIEAGLPIFNSDTIGKAELTLSARREKFSTAGWFNTWKAGFTYDTPITGLRFRGLRSRDVRAPGLDELFAPVSVGRNTVVDAFGANAGKTFTVANVTSGNPDLRPESSNNTQFGVVYQPTWFAGFSASIDYWKIALKDGVTALTPQQIVDVCFAGNTEVCGNITRDGTGTISQIQTKVFNLSQLNTDGVDIEASYRMNLDSVVPNIAFLSGGQANFRILATNTFNYDIVSGIPGLATQHIVGQLQQSRSDTTTEKWRILATQGLSNGPWGFTVTERWTSAAKLNNTFIECASNCPVATIAAPTINDNHVPSTLYFDLGGRFAFSKAMEGYFKVDNVFNANPRRGPIFNGRTNINENGVTGDLLGRRFQLGLRVRY
jgi:iron complex outermembrane receptor protein